MQQTETRAEQHCAPQAKRKWLNVRNVAIAASLAFALALYFGWNWLVAAGLASIVITVLPCLGMCVLGMCMGRAAKKDTRD